MDEQRTFIPGVVPPKDQLKPAWWFAFQDRELLVDSQSSPVTVPCLIDFKELGLKAKSQHYLGRLGSRHCYAVELAEGAPAPPGMTFQGLRHLYGRVDEDLFQVAGCAVQIVEWDRINQFCGRCGHRMESRQTERAKECPRCGLLKFPRLSPAIIVLVERGHELLLARARHFPPGLHSVIAGFVEPGETLEGAVRREVQEEVGLTIKGIRYFGSQPWPFPDSLMIGFIATYESGEICLEDLEIEDAGWFTADNLPSLPGKISIARRLIDWFLSKQVKSTGDNREKAG
ncbi:MAG: NAD(+) diphosphatase [Deltaproteobacteria bacterium]|nr:NAD(+) diphosphatase [Deltaproteobacteria bacterium]